jgi:hypothetical protein
MGDITSCTPHPHQHFAKGRLMSGETVFYFIVLFLTPLLASSTFSSLPYFRRYSCSTATHIQFCPFPTILHTPSVLPLKGETRFTCAYSRPPSPSPYACRAGPPEGLIVESSASLRWRFHLPAFRTISESSLLYKFGHFCDLSPS